MLYNIHKYIAFPNIWNNAYIKSLRVARGFKKIFLFHILILLIIKVHLGTSKVKNIIKIWIYNATLYIQIIEKN